MTGHLFDAITQHTTEVLRRREMFAIVANAMAFRLTGGAQNARAACKKVGKKCDRNKECCDGARCQGKKCQCKSGFSRCNKKCFDLSADANHCGFCDKACPAGSCRDGACQCGTSPDDCPDACTCALSVSGFVCIGSAIPLDITCEVNSDCSPGGACLVTVDGFRCAAACAR